MLLKEYVKKTQGKIIVEPVSINDFGLPEIRPLDLSMSSARLDSVNSIGFASPTFCIEQLIR